MNKKVSIVVPIYNGEKYIDKCAQNLMDQTYENVEFILVDDGSTDSTSEKCDFYAKMDNRFIVVHKENGGLSSARNAGTDKATGDYIVYYDVDDDITDTLVEDNVKLADEHDADVVFFCFWYFNVDTNIRSDNLMSRGFVGNREQFFYGPLNESIDNEIFNAPWNKMYRLSFLRENKLRFLPEYPIYEDIVFASRMLVKADRIVINNQMYYTYYVRSSGSLITKYIEGYFDSVTKYYTCALEYCDRFDNNETQILKFTNLYVKLVNTNLKQISCKKELSFEEKCKQINKICNNELFRNAVKNSKLDGYRKKVIKNLVLAKNAAAIIAMYSAKALLE